jgi:hypothetical protein
VVLLSRSEWGAAEPRGQRPPGGGPGSRPEGLVVHWVGSSVPVGQGDPRPVIRRIQDHQFSQGYVDIAYNLLVSWDGRVWEGCGLSRSGAANGGGTNRRYASICWLGSAGDPFTAAARAAIIDVWRNVVGGVLKGHREVNSTACPGQEVMSWITQVRGPGLAPPTPPAPVPSPSPAPGLEGLRAEIERIKRSMRVGPTLRPGSRGQDVADWQLALIVGYPHPPARTLVIDGVFGHHTTQSTKAFQRSAHLVVDGVVGPKTRSAMHAVLSVRFPS